MFIRRSRSDRDIDRYQYAVATRSKPLSRMRGAAPTRRTGPCARWPKSWANTEAGAGSDTIMGHWVLDAVVASPSGAL